MVSRMSDEDIWRLNRGGHDPHKIYAAYAAAVKHKGQPTVILAKTIKGFGLGKQGQAKNPTHQLKKVDAATIREMRDQFNIPIPDDKLEELPFYIPPRRLAGDEVPARAAQGARRLPAAAPAQGGRGASRCRRSRLSTRCSKGSGEGREISTTMAFVRVADGAGARQGDRQAHRADRARRGAHLRHGRDVPPARHLRLRGPEVRAGRQGPGDVLPRGQAGPDPRGRHQRGGRVLLVDRRGDFVQPFEPGDGAVLHLLFDVRLAARRRPRLGGGRPARARLPARRHGRAAPR